MVVLSSSALGAVILTNLAASKQVAIPTAVEMLAIVVATACGVLSAREHRLDLVGSVALGVTCSLGGGILRDIILQVDDVYILRNPDVLLLAIIVALVVFIFPRPVEKLDRIIDVLDIFAVGLFAVTGADKAICYEFAPVIAVMMGFFTGVGGGMIRDICLAQVPHIFRSGNLYAIAAIGGSIVYVVLIDVVGLCNVAAAAIGVAVTMLIRWASLRYNITSPTDLDIRDIISIFRTIKK